MKAFTGEQIYRFVKESNKIEGINREPTEIELDAFDHFMQQTVITVTTLVQYVEKIQPNAKLRTQQGMNVRVGGHFPPRGGTHIQYKLIELLDQAQTDGANPFYIHIDYETLHPFMDGNGRSGRALWYWMMKDNPLVNLGFLHAWYYQSLQNVRES